MVVNGYQHGPSSHGALVQRGRQSGSHAFKCVIAHYDKHHQERLWSVGYDLDKKWRVPGALKDDYEREKGTWEEGERER